MKQKISTVMCIVLLAVQLNALVNAEEDRTVSSGNASEMTGSGELVGEGRLVQPAVSNGDLSGAVSDGNSPETVGNGEIIGEEKLVLPEVSAGDADGEGQGDVSNRDDLAGGNENGQPDDEQKISDGDAVSADSPAESADTITSGNLPVEEPVDIGSLAVVKLQVPCNLNFVIDPWEICGEGSVWSKEYKFSNGGETAVWLDFRDIKCDVREGVVCAGSQVDAETISVASDKMIQLRLAFENGDVVNVSEESNSYRIMVNAGESVSMVILGEVSNPEVEMWQTGDASISLTYSAAVCDEEGAQK